MLLMMSVPPLQLDQMTLSVVAPLWRGSLSGLLRPSLAQPLSEGLSQKRSLNLVHLFREAPRY